MQWNWFTRNSKIQKKKTRNRYSNRDKKSVSVQNGNKQRVWLIFPTNLWMIQGYNYDFLENCNALGKSHFEALWTLNLNDLIAVDVYKL